MRYLARLQTTVALHVADGASADPQPVEVHRAVRQPRRRTRRRCWTTNGLAERVHLTKGAALVVLGQEWEGPGNENRRDE